MMMALVLMRPEWSAGCLATCKFPKLLVLYVIFNFYYSYFSRYLNFVLT